MMAEQCRNVSFNEPVVDLQLLFVCCVRTVQFNKFVTWTQQGGNNPIQVCWCVCVLKLWRISTKSGISVTTPKVSNTTMTKMRECKTQFNYFKQCGYNTYHQVIYSGTLLENSFHTNTTHKDYTLLFHYVFRSYVFRIIKKKIQVQKEMCCRRGYYVALFLLYVHFSTWRWSVFRAETCSRK